MPAAIFFFPLTIAAADSVTADKSASIELPTMTVFATRNPDNTYTEVSEVAWENGKDPSIVLEKDGSYTAKSTFNSYSLKSLLASLGRPTVNIDLGYAVNSVSMTAEGSLTLSTLLKAFEYLKEGVTLELRPSLGDGSVASKNIMQRRLEVLRKNFERSSQVNFKVTPAKVMRKNAKSSTRSDVWRIQIRRTA